MGQTPVNTVNNGAHDDVRITKKALCPAACLGRKDTLSGHVAIAMGDMGTVTNYEKRGSCVLGDINGSAHAVMVGARCGGSHDRQGSTSCVYIRPWSLDRLRSQDRASMPTMGCR